MRCSGIKQHSSRGVVDRKHTQYHIWGFLGFFGVHVVEAAVAVVGVVGGELLAGGDTALLLSRCSGVGVVVAGGSYWGAVEVGVVVVVVASWPGVSSTPVLKTRT